MNLGEIIGIVSSIAGIAYGFGTQGNRINVLRRDNNHIADMHRDTQVMLGRVLIELAEVKKDIEYIKDRQP